MPPATREFSQRLLDEGLTSPAGLLRALGRQREAGGSLETALLELGLVDEDRLVAALARAAGLPAAPRSAWEQVDARARRVFPSKVAERHGLAPFALDGRELSLVVTWPVDQALLEEVSFMLSLQLAPHVGPEWRVRALIQRLYGGPLAPRLAALAARAPAGGPGPVAAAGDPPGPAAPPVTVGEQPELGPPGPDPGAAIYLGPAMPAVKAARVSPGRPTPTGPPSGLAGFTRQPGEPLEPMSDALAQALEAFDAESPASAAPEVTAPPPAEEPAPPAAATGPVGAPDRAAPPRWTLAEARAALEQARTRDEVVLTALRYARDFFQFTALFAVTGDAVAGHDGLGAEGDARDLVRTVAIYASDPGVFRTTIETRAPYLGRLDRSAPGNQAVLDALGRGSPRTVLVTPILLRHRPVCLLYGDNGEAPVSARRLGDLLVFSSTVGAALERIIRTRKQEPAAAAPLPVSPEPPAPPPPLPEPPAPAPLAVTAPVPAPEEVRPWYPPPAPPPLKPPDAPLEPPDVPPEPVAAEPPDLAPPPVAVEPPAPPPAPEEPPASTPPPEVEAPVPAEPRATVEAPVPKPAPAADPGALVEPLAEQWYAAAERYETPPPRPAHRFFERPERAWRGPAREVGPVSAAEAEYVAAAGALEPEPLPPPSPPPPLLAESVPAPEVTAEVALPEPERLPPEPPIVAEPPAPEPTPPPAPPEVAGEPPVTAGTAPTGAPPPEEPEPQGLPDDPAYLVGAYLTTAPATPAREQLLQRLAAHAAAVAPILCELLPGPLEVAPAVLAATPASAQGPVLEALVAVGQPAVPLLLAVLGDPDPARRRAAAALLGAIGDPATLVSLADRCLDPDAAVAEAAREALAAQRGSPAMRPIPERLRRALASGLPARAAPAARALLALRDPESIPALIQALEGTDPATAAAAAEALAAITLQRHGTSARHWLLWWKENRGRGRAEWLFGGLTAEDQQVRAAAAAELARVATPPVRYAADMGVAERETAARAWASWFTRSGHRI